MKRNIYTLIALLIVMTNLQAQWEILNEGVKGSLNAIDFVDENVGWIAGSDGLLFKTEDGGQSWYPIPFNKDWSISMIDFLNDSIGWAIGYEYSDVSDKAIILKTYNGGHTWSIQKSQTQMDSYRSLFVVNDSVVYVAGIKGSFGSQMMILKTSDGGASWVDVTPYNRTGQVTSIWFYNTQIGLATGSYWPSDTTYNAIVWSTHDSGLTWEENIITDLLEICNLQGINDSTAYFLIVLKSDPNYHPIICKTTDRFKSWSMITQNDPTNRINSFIYLGDGHFCSIMQTGSISRRFYLFSYVSRSTDAGKTWEQKCVAGPWNLNRIYFCTDKVGFCLGGGTLLESVDGGNNWTAQEFSYSFDNVCFINSEKGFAGGGLLDTHFGGYGDLFMTLNGGKSWEPILSTRQKIESCLFMNDSFGLALSVNQIFRTVDGGKNWAVVEDINSDSANSFIGTDMFFINEKMGWAIGHGGGPAIFETTNQGQNWDLLWHKKEIEGWTFLNSIYFVNEYSGWAVGDSGLIVQYNDQNHWQEQPSITDLPLNKVFFIDENNGLVAGGYLNYDGYRSVLFKTTNGGETWEKIPNVPYLIYDIYFHDQQHGWAVGTDSTYSGVILATEDGGAHWAEQVDGLVGPLRSFSNYENYLWAVGDYGLVLRTDLATAVADDKDPHLPSAFKLLQNYPNPFNETTAISYQLSALSQVELSIFNLLGQKVAILFSEKQAAGSYKGKWDGSKFSSGVYFCRLEAGDFVKVIKLALVK